MAKCAICEKGAHFGNNVSHSHRKSPKMWKSNVKSVRVKTENGATKRMYVCTSCLKSGKVERDSRNGIWAFFRCQAYDKKVRWTFFSHVKMMIRQNSRDIPVLPCNI